MRNLCFIMKERTSYLRIFLVLAFPICIQGHPSQEDLLKETSFSSAREKRAAEVRVPVDWGAQMCFDGTNRARKCLNSPSFLESIFGPYFDKDEEIDLCDDSTLDAIFIQEDGSIYAFRGPYFWKVIEDKLAPDYPKLISDHWIGLPNNLDAAFALKNDHIYFFKGSQYWKFNGTKLNDGYPKDIKEGFPGIPNNIQAVTTYGPREYIYFFKGDQYWRYNPNREPRVNKNYPKLISKVWEGIPNDLDEAVVQKNGVIYFLKGLRHWTYQDEAFKPFIEGKFEPSPEFDDELNLCDNATVDAIIGFNDSMRTEYVFRGPYYWKILQDKVVNDYPRLICDTWLGLPDNIDAGFVNRNSKIFFFKGSKYWQFSGTKRDRGFPKLIKEGFPGIPDDIQAVTLWSQTNFVYFFKGKHYWRFEPDRKPPVRKTYPKLIGEVWEGVPDDLDEAMLYPNGVTYFLKGLKYWKFNDGKLRVDAGYPAPNAVNWFGCKGDP